MRLSAVNLIRKVSCNMSIFTQVFKPITGTMTWEEKDVDYDYHQEIARSAFADMLHDSERNKKYYAAVKAAIEKKHSLGESANVLDIGTGTGLLSMMAAHCGADTVTACEAFKPMAECAAGIIKANGFGSKIKLVGKRSTSMTVGEGCDMERRANILVTEVFDTELIGEGALSTFHHAHKFLLEENSLVVPTSGKVWIQVVESDLVRGWNRLSPLVEPDSGEILIEAPKAMETCAGANAVHDLQLSQLPREAFKALTRALPVFEFDWSGKTPILFDRRNLIKEKAVESGIAHAAFMWWDLQMDFDGKILLSCAPFWEHPDVKRKDLNEKSDQELAKSIPWRDHWMQAIYYFPNETFVTKDREIQLACTHDEYCFWFNIQDEKDSTVKKEPICTCGIHIAYSRTRIGQLNDIPRRNTFLKVMKQKLRTDSVCLCLSDGSLLGLAAAKLGAKKVYIYEPNFLSRKATESLIKTNELSEKIQIVDSLESLPFGSEIDLIVGEPSFITSILPWDNFLFWSILSSYSSHIERLPLKAKIKGVVVEFMDLHKIRAPLGVCEGFDLSNFDALVLNSSDVSDSSVEAQPLWEYPAKALSVPFEMGTFDFKKNLKLTNTFEVNGSLPLIQEGTCNGIALWVDYSLDSEVEVSTGPTKEVIPGEQIEWDLHTRQGVFLLKDVKSLNKNDVLLWSLKFSDGAMSFNFRFK